jgi:hypothetical protein
VLEAAVVALGVVGACGRHIAPAAPSIKTVMASSNRVRWFFMRISLRSGISCNRPRKNFGAA